MARLYIIRHGKPTATWGGREADPGLDAAGIEQAQAARDWLLARPGPERPQRVVSSPLRRCRETAIPTAEALGVAVELDPAIGEIPTPRTLPETGRTAWLQGAFEGTWGQISGDIDYEAWRRGVLAALRTRGAAAVFSHYVAINAVVSLLTGDERVVCFRPAHASITVLECDGDRLSLLTRGAEAETAVL